jgi:REP element-mobilizing transposase RayT
MPSAAKLKYLNDVVARKSRWHRQPTDEEKSLGFLGWHQRGYLPHCDFPGLVQFVTFRLWDSMPSSCRSEWEQLLAIENDRERRTKLENYLDRGLGECRLREPTTARLAESALLHFHDARYELRAWCVMPNHVHVLVQIWRFPLWKIVRSWKRFIATNADAPERRPPARLDQSSDTNSPGRRPALQPLRWQREYWDTFMRDESQERTAIRYIENNPVKSLLCRTADQWEFGSARFRDKFARLLLSKTSFGDVDV